MKDENALALGLHLLFGVIAIPTTAARSQSRVTSTPAVGSDQPHEQAPFGDSLRDAGASQIGPARSKLRSRPVKDDDNNGDDDRSRQKESATISGLAVMSVQPTPEIVQLTPLVSTSRGPDAVSPAPGLPDGESNSSHLEISSGADQYIADPMQSSGHADFQTGKAIEPSGNDDVAQVGPKPPQPNVPGEKASNSETNALDDRALSTVIDVHGPQLVVQNLELQASHQVSGGSEIEPDAAGRSTDAKSDSPGSELVAALSGDAGARSEHISAVLAHITAKIQAVDSSGETRLRKTSSAKPEQMQKPSSVDDGEQISSTGKAKSEPLLKDDSGSQGDGASTQKQDVSDASLALPTAPPAQLHVAVPVMAPTSAPSSASHEHAQATSSASGAAPASSTSLPSVTSPNPGTREVAASAINMASLLQRAGRAEMRIGLHSPDYGNISIRTASTRDGISAEVSLDHNELAHALAVHAPELQTRLAEGQNVDLRITHNLSGGAFHGNMAGSGEDSRRRDPAPAAPAGYKPASSLQQHQPVNVPPAALIENNLSTRLDIRA